MEEKKTTAKEWLKEKFEQGKELGGKLIEKAKENSDVVVVAAEIAAVVGLAAVSSNKASKTMYSEELGESVKLNKKLSNQDKIIMDHLMAEEGLSKIQAAEKIGRIKK
jgi:hypothetical protein